MKVLLIDHAPVAGGVEMMIRDLLTALDPSLVSPIVVTDPASPMRGRFGRAAPEVALPLTRLKGNPMAAAALWTSAAQLARLARRFQADVLQTFTARTHLIGALAGVLARRPVVWRVNDDTLPPALARAFGRLPRRVIAVSDYLRRKYRGRLPVTDVIPDGVPLPPVQAPAAARAALGLAAEALVVVLVARLVRWKGQAVFLRALGRLAGQQAGVHGLAVGGWSAEDNRPGPLAGGEPYYRELQALARDLGLKGRVTFTGQTEAAADVFTAADIVVHASTLPEPFGRVIVEAMAAGRPVVAAQAGGVLEIVVPGETGLLTPPGDDEALAAALAQLAERPDQRERMGRAGRARAEREYGLALMAERFTRVWAEVAGRADLH